MRVVEPFICNFDDRIVKVHWIPYWDWWRHEIWNCMDSLIYKSLSLVNLYFFKARRLYVHGVLFDTCLTLSFGSHKGSIFFRISHLLKWLVYPSGSGFPIALPWDWCNGASIFFLMSENSLHRGSMKEHHNTIYYHMAGDQEGTWPDCKYGYKIDKLYKASPCVLFLVKS